MKIVHVSPTASPPETKLSPSRRNIHILVVDDSASVAATLAMLLESEGYSAIFALSGGAALEMLSGIAVDVAIIDITMPVFDGIETAAAICKKLKACKILLMSGSSDATSLLDRARELNLQFEILAKPIPPRELLAKLEFLAAQVKTSSASTTT